MLRNFLSTMKMRKFVCLLIVSFAFIGISAQSSLPQVDANHWCYFGWEEEHPKAISTMGGALYSRRPMLQKGDDHSWEFSRPAWHKDADKPVFFMLSVDGSEAFYPDEFSPTRRMDVQWNLAEGYLPFPCSLWKKDGVAIEIMHVGRRILNDSVNAVYTQVRISNEDARPHHLSLHIAGASVAERCLTVKKTKYQTVTDTLLVTADVNLKSGKALTYDFIFPANGTGSEKEILSQGGFSKAYAAEKERIDAKMNSLTMPVSLPDERFITLWKSSMCNMWNATVQKPDDYEQRGSGGNIKGFYQYDRVFDHDVPDMAIQYILEGNLSVARKIMAGATYKRLAEGVLKWEAYLDAVPKFLMTYATYLQVTGDESIFTPEIMARLKTCSRAVDGLREFSDEAKQKGVYGLVRKGSTLDNNKRTYTIVDDFAALHGFVSYQYICQHFGLKEEADWAKAKMIDLNDALNAALRKSAQESGLDWYNACFLFDMDYHLVSGPGNWLGTTFMMPSFPWDAQLKGFNLGGEWADRLDCSVDKWLEMARFYGCPQGSVGAWWGAKYGAEYNTGMVLPLLSSERYRTLIPQSIAWLLDNQSAPMQWGESFHRPAHPGDWTRPEVDQETWGLGFIRKGMLQMCVSLKADGDVILGRGIPDEWIESGVPIQWKRVRINNGKQIDFSIHKKGGVIEIVLSGDRNDGNYIVDIPYLKGNISKATADGGQLISCQPEQGKVIVSGDSRKISISVK